MIEANSNPNRRARKLALTLLAAGCLVGGVVSQANAAGGRKLRPPSTTTTAPATTAPATTAPPTTAPPTTAPPVSSVFPSSANTGVPAGTVLKASGSLTVTTPGTVIDGLDITGTVTITASNVTVKRSRITGSAFALVYVKDGVTGVRVEDSELNGSGSSGTSNSMGVYGPATVLRSNIYGVENGVAPFSNTVVQDNYIHDLLAPGSPHYDGIQIDGGISNVVIQHNTINLAGHDQTSAVMIDNYFGPTSNVSVTGNRLLGGGFTLYSDGQFSGGTIAGVSFTNNRLGKGYWGYASIVNNVPVWSGNTDDTTGAVVSSNGTTTTTVTTTTTPATTPPATTPATTAPATTTPATTAPATTVPPATVPPATVPPATGGFPTAANTGVPTGTVLTASGSLIINTAGTVIDSLNISGTVTINANNVTVRRSLIRGSDFSIINIGASVTGTLIENVEIDGQGSGAGTNAINGAATVRFSNIYGVENGMNVTGSSTLSDNYIHGLLAPGSPHYDGIQIDGGVSNVVVQHNTINLAEHDQTSAVMVDNYFGPISNVAVTGNRVIGGGYTVYSDGQFTGGTISGVSFTNNRFGKGYWGYASINRSSPVWSGNVDDVTGAAI